MTKVLGLTGGIGSGKTTVSKMFSDLDVPVYNADYEAKKLMQNSLGLKDQIINLLGDNAYKNNVLNKNFISKKIFKDASLLQKINSIVHPAVIDHYKNWFSAQDSVYVVKEVAILFEINSQKNFDFILTITAPKSLRIQRIIKRDKKSIKDIEAIMSNQLPVYKQLSNSDFVIHNNAINETRKRVCDIHNKIIKKSIIS
ncbi:MAG: dephospho-CoA kinase [Flavobacteriaceae bacterium]|mgnify:FL=1|nr:dephospho-CoA kinase [Flavobacteriaceae bacterium]|tara:strand:+ start:6270 stop:6866 length:597 start_codon:yes stop_codon:yes gene_type:complete